MASKAQPIPRVEYLRRLVEGGFSDIHVIQLETAERVLTEKRMELVEEIAKEDVDSMRELAQRVDRDKSIVSRDLDVLFEAEIIDYEPHGKAKKPVLAHDNILVEPIVFEGQVTAKHEEN